jgi:hypothetical protein
MSDVAKTVLGSTIILVGPEFKEVDLSKPFHRIDVIPELERIFNTKFVDYCMEDYLLSVSNSQK